MSTSGSTSSSNVLPPTELSKVRKFLSSIPPSSDSTASNVTFDAKRDATESDLCRKIPGGGLNCTKILGSTTALFAAIQKMGYFCTMPVDPTSTEIHCTRITEGPVAPELDVGKTSNSVGSIA
ncbi:hypothetical protein P389DRAFT_196328 [Cystobasidium minutum MCA 4210]|uniref:uncharacterized protein n=1 Tax=Cystobasidium minutum MCA 4210 TaxID=1397322 RepID=UPI0034CEBE20|eukprot:jgi/Rhomi1/196328/gm1.4542_g